MGKWFNLLIGSIFVQSHRRTIKRIGLYLLSVTLDHIISDLACKCKIKIMLTCENSLLAAWQDPRLQSASASQAESLSSRAMLRWPW